MNDYVCFLVSVLYGSELIKAAIKIPHSKLNDDERTYPMEPENREKIHQLLPLHVRSCGPIVEIQDIFEVSEVAR